MREADASKLKMSNNDRGQVSVISERAFTEQHKIGNGAAIYFSSESNICRRLESGSYHMRYADRLIKIHGLVRAGADTTVYGVLVGLAGEINAPDEHQRANVILEVEPSNGVQR